MHKNMDGAGAAALEELAALQVEHGLADEAFSKQVKLGYSGSSWGKIKAGTFSGSWEKASASVKRALITARGGIARSVGRFVLFEHIDALLSGIALAREEEGPNRLLIVVGKMGMGKTEIARYLAREEEAAVVEGRPAWAGSYMAALGDFAAALGLQGDWRSVAAAEQAVVEELRLSPRLIVVDEGNYFSSQGLNFLKLVLNRSRSVVVLLTLPPDFARMLATNRHESRQLVRRAVAILQIPDVSERDVRSMHAAGWPDVAINGHAPQVAAAANKFGGFDLVARVLDEADPADGEDLPAAVARVRGRLDMGMK